MYFQEQDIFMVSSYLCLFICFLFYAEYFFPSVIAFASSFLLYESFNFIPLHNFPNIPGSNAYSKFRLLFSVRSNHLLKINAKWSHIGKQQRQERDGKRFKWFSNFSLFLIIFQFNKDFWGSILKNIMKRWYLSIFKRRFLLKILVKLGFPLRNSLHLFHCHITMVKQTDCVSSLCLYLLFSTSFYHSIVSDVVDKARVFQFRQRLTKQAVKKEFYLFVISKTLSQG